MREEEGTGCQCHEDMSVDKIMANTYLATNPNTISVPNATLTQIASLSLSEGTWLVIASHQYNKDANAYYVDSFQVNGQITNRDTLRMNMNAGGGATLVRLYELTQPSVVSYHTYQGTGSAIDARYITMQAIKLA